MNARIMPADFTGNRDCTTVASEVLISGDVLALPTDTVYGLAVAAAQAGAVQKLFALKRRPAQHSIAVLVSDTAAAEWLIQLTDTGRRLASRFWPGPLTLVASRSPDAPTCLSGDATLGVRVPDDDLVRHLAASGPLAVTSANLHGEPTPATAHEVALMFPNLSLVIDGGPLPGRASTVVDITGPSVIVLREGPISADQIKMVLGSNM